MTKGSKRQGRFCTMDWCDKPLYSLKYGLCFNCYEKNRRGALRDPRIPKEKPQCSFDPCDRTAETRGLCGAHYIQQWSGKELTPVRKHVRASVHGELRQCKTCGQWKNEQDEFYNRSKSTKKQSECKSCAIKRNSAHQARRKLEKDGVTL